MSLEPTKTLEFDDGLRVDTYYLECLAQGSYLIQHEGNAFLVDPRRDIEIYTKALEKFNLRLKGVFESHLHADFVSGHNELHSSMGVTIFIGENSGAKFPHYPTADAETFLLSSKYRMRAIATPGHTFGCVSWVLEERESGKAVMAFTGDTLFVGGVGRPDLVGALQPDATPEKLSTLMFASLKKLMALPDDCIVFPAHGPGSPCGKGISADLSSTIGKERETNPALQIKNEEEFIKFNTSGLGKAPQYFPSAVKANLVGAPELSAEMKAVSRADAGEFKELVKSTGAVILDTRNARDFADSHIAGSVNIPLGNQGGVKLQDEDGNFAIWVGTLIAPHAKVAIVSTEDKEDESIERLARIGYGSNVVAILKGGFKTWQDAKEPTEHYDRVMIEKEQDVLDLQSNGLTFVDVRTPGEFTCAMRGHLNGAVNLPLNEVEDHATDLAKDKKYVVYCLGGFRSTIATSIMRQLGYDAVDVQGGYDGAILKHAKSLTTAQK